MNCVRISYLLHFTKPINSACTTKLRGPQCVGIRSGIDDEHSMGKKTRKSRLEQSASRHFDWLLAAIEVLRILSVLSIDFTIQTKTKAWPGLIY